MLPALVMRTANARVENKSCEITADNTLYLSAATSDDLNAVCGELIQCARAHISCQHNLNAHLLKVGSYARLTAATLGRGQLLATDNLLILYGVNRVVVAMSEMVIYATVACWKCYLHR